MLTTIRSKLIQRRKRPNREYWETLDYGEKTDLEILKVLYYKKVTAKTIKQIIKTSKPGYQTCIASQHKLAQVEDILNLIDRLDKEKPEHLYDQTIHVLFFLKRKEINSYLQKTYKLDAKSIPDMQIQEMLNINFIRM
jgi:hypothetical protein